MAVVPLVEVGTALPVVSRGHCGSSLVGCHPCPSHGCCPQCSIQAVICPGGTGSGSRWHGRCWAQKLEEHFDFPPRCSSSFTRAFFSKGGEELALYTIPAPGEFSSSGVTVILTHLSPACSKYHTQLIQPLSFLTATSYN